MITPNRVLLAHARSWKLVALVHVAFCAALLLAEVSLVGSVCNAQWQTSTIQRLDAGGTVVLPTERQDVTEGWNRIAQIPYMVYMPAKLMTSGDASGLGTGLTVMALWAGGFLLIQRLLWRLGLRRYTAMGA